MFAYWLVLLLIRDTFERTQLGFAAYKQTAKRLDQWHTGVDLNKNKSEHHVCFCQPYVFCIFVVCYCLGIVLYHFQKKKYDIFQFCFMNLSKIMFLRR